MMWFSTMLKLLVSAGEEGPVEYQRSVFLLQAPDWDSARDRAIELGKGAEETHLNADRQQVTIRLAAVETLDLLGEEILDGREVYSEPTPLGEDQVEMLRPEDSQPTQSGV
jgi:hypothetical protein